MEVFTCIETEVYVPTMRYPLREYWVGRSEITWKDHREGEVIRTPGIDIILTRRGPFVKGFEHILEDAVKEGITTYSISKTPTGASISFPEIGKIIKINLFTNTIEVETESSDPEARNDDTEYYEELPEDLIPKKEYFLLADYKIILDREELVYDSTMYYKLTLPKRIVYAIENNKLKSLTIRTQDGVKRLPRKPRFLLLPKRENFGYSPFEKLLPGFLFDWKLAAIVTRKGDVAVNGYAVDVGNAIITYNSPNSWFVARRDGIFYSRVDDYTIVKDKKDPYGFGGHHWTVINRRSSQKSDLYVFPTLKTKQMAMYAEIDEKYAYLFGIITPEGIHSVRVPVERIMDERTISIFDDDVDPLAVHMPFPVSVPFEEAYYDARKYIHIVIDGYRFQKPVDSVENVPDDVEKLFIDSGIRRDEWGMVMNYGLNYL